MKSIEEIAYKYIREQYIDYGDLNDKAEIQIRDAVIFGLKQGQKLTIPVVVGQSEQCRHDSEPIIDRNGFYICPDCGKYGEDC